jgi:hypothetical protein
MAANNLGKTQFYDLDFTRVKRVDIQQCAFTKIESSNISWFSQQQLEHLPIESRRDIFRQLKHAMAAQGNRIDQLHFQAAEMEAYRKSLKFWREPADSLVLSIGKYTNNFGTNYVLPALWIVVVTILIFVCSALAQRVSVRQNWGAAFQVINPAHPIDYLASKDKLSNTFMTVDFIGRVVISVLIYQLITPFRKFARD